jgi:hypothetical protein
MRLSHPRVAEPAIDAGSAFFVPIAMSVNLRVTPSRSQACRAEATPEERKKGLKKGVPGNPDLVH